MKKTKGFRDLHAKVLTYIKRGTKIENGKNKDMLAYIEKSRDFKAILDEMAEKIIQKWDL